VGQDAASEAHHCRNTNVGCKASGQPKKMRPILIILILITWTDLVACDCHRRGFKEAQEVSIRESPLIFVGDILTSDEKKRTYEIKVVEVFKGESKTKTIKGKLLTSCSGLADKGRWIIYATTYKNGVIDFDICGLSRSFENPHLIYLWATDYKIPPPPTKEYDTDSKYSIQANIDFQKEMTKLKEKALTDLEIEIEELRKIK